MKAVMRIRAVAIAAALMGTLALAAPAGAQTPGAPEVLYVQSSVYVNRLSPDTALIVGVYRCSGGQPIHLWVSAKQGGPDPTAPHSGATVTSWYDTNITPPPAVICDGRYHAVAVTVGRHPNKQQLTNGPAWVQFCLVDFNSGIVASQSKWATVQGA